MKDLAGQRLLRAVATSFEVGTVPWPAVMRCRRPVAECDQPMEFINMEHTKKLLWVPLARVMLSRFYERRHSVDPVEEVLALI